MKTKMRPRYYCDYCKKAGGNPSAILRHEVSCTANPNRTCKLCLGTNGSDGHLNDGKLAFMDPRLENGWAARMEALREATEDCPCCILAVLRQTGTTNADNGYPEGSEWPSAISGSYCLLGFDFKAEMREAMGNFKAKGMQDIAETEKAAEHLAVAIGVTTDKLLSVMGGSKLGE